MKNKNSIVATAVAIGSLMLGITGTALAATPAVVNLATAGNFVILSQAGITDANPSITKITGNIGASPITGAAILITCAEVTGKIYSVDAAGPLPCRLTNASLLGTAVNDMQAAYTNAAGRAPTSAATINVGAGSIGGLTLKPGVYKWNSAVTIPTNLTLSGGANDVWIFQIAGTLNISSGKKIILKGGAQAKNIFWQVSGATTLGTYSAFSGNILTATNIALQTGAILNGRALAQTAVTLDANGIK